MIDSKMKRAMKWHTEGYKELQRRNKEEKKMEDKKYYSGSVSVTTWRSRRTFGALDDIMSNHKTDLITFREGVFAGMVVDSNRKISESLSVDTKKRFTKEEITELITTAWDKGEYAEDQTDISWAFNPEGFTGTVYLTTVYVRGGEGYESINDHQYSSLETMALCIVEIKNGKYLRGVKGTPEIIGLFKHHSGTFESKDDIRLFVKNKWEAKVFGPKANYYNLSIIKEG